ncbi:MAG: hypothetical protein II997_03135 [Clostridia bacterium]|nr:hypothetical protein [Clostridia bacterium]
MESKLKEISERYDIDFLELKSMDITGQLDIIEFYAYLLTKQNKEK